MTKNRIAHSCARRREDGCRGALIHASLCRFIISVATVGVAFSGVDGRTIGGDLSEFRHRLEDDDVLDFFLIRDVAFLTRESQLGDRTPVRDVTKVVSPAAAAETGLPSREIKQFIEQLCQSSVVDELVKACLHRDGHGNLVWTIEWELDNTATRFSSGPPDEFHAVVTGRGDPVPPEMYLFDHMELAIRDESGDPVRLFSVLSFEDLLPIAGSGIDEKQILRAASEAFNKSVAKFEVTDSYRPLAPRRVTVPAKLSSHKGAEGDREVWAVRFVVSSVKEPEDVKYGGSIIVWVTSDLMTSTVTEGMWAAMSQRPHDNGEGPTKEKGGKPRAKKEKWNTTPKGQKDRQLLE